MGSLARHDNTPDISSERLILTNECPPGPVRMILTIIYWLLFLQRSDDVFTFRRGTTGSAYYFASRVNPDNPNYLDMTLEADTTGWVGIGFSTDILMVCPVLYYLVHYIAI